MPQRACQTLTIRFSTWMVKSKGHVSFFLSFFFNWRIIGLQNFVFCQTSKWISHRYTYNPSLLSLPLISLPSHSTRLIQRSYLSFLSHTENSCWLSTLHMVTLSFRVIPSIHLTLSSSLPMSISLFSMSVSPLLPCK